MLLQVLLLSLAAVSGQLADDKVDDCSWLPDDASDNVLSTIRNVFVDARRFPNPTTRTKSVIHCGMQADLKSPFADAKQYYAAVLISDPPEYASYDAPAKEQGVTQMVSLRAYSGSAADVFDGFKLPSVENNLYVCGTMYAGVNSTSASAFLGGIVVPSANHDNEAIRVRYFIMDPDTSAWAAYDDYVPVDKSRMSGGAIAAIIIAVIAVFAALGFAGFRLWRQRRRGAARTATNANTSFAPYQAVEE